MHKILVFPCGSEIGLEIHRCLNDIKDIKLFGGGTKLDHGKFCFENHIELPNLTEKGFLRAFNSAVKSNEIRLIYPAHDDAITWLTQNRNKIHCEVIASDFKICSLLRSKKLTYDYFKHIVLTPKINPKEFPVFLKPPIGQGSKGTYKANSAKEVRFYLKRNPELLILEYLPNEEFTIDCFTDFNGNLRYCQPRKRSRILNGISVNTFFIEDEYLKKIAHTINNSVVLNGAWFFQTKLNKDNQHCLLEISPRIAGSSGLSRAKGVNLPLLTFYNHLKKPIEILSNNIKIELDRSLNNKFRIKIDFEHVYIDLDDTIIVKNKLNSNIVKLMAEWVNDGKKIHLLTKHKKNLDKTLKQFRINDFFDSKKQIDKGDNKYLYIRYKKSIFIDDSFQERQEIKKYLDIPVFGPEAFV